MTLIFKLVDPFIEPCKGIVVIKCHARLHRIDNRKTIVLYCLCQKIGLLFVVPGKSPRDKCGARCKRQREWVDWRFNNRHWCRLIFLPDFGCWRKLSSCQTVNLIIVCQKREINIAPCCMNQVIPSLAILITIASNNDNCQAMICKLDPLSNRHGSSMKTIKSIGLHPIWK